MSGESPKSSALLSLGFVLVVLLVFGAYVGYSTGGVSPSSLQLSNSVPCATQFPPPPANSQTYFKNGTVANNGWLRVLITPENSTGQICVQYSSGNLGNSYSGKVYTNIEKASPNGSLFTSTPLASISANPSRISLYPGSNQTVVYTINSSTGSKGFYGISMLQFCPDIPIAIGYQKSELNLSDFSWAYGEFYSCPALFLSAQIVGLTNMQVAYLPLQTRYTMKYNITHSSVVSYNPSSSEQNVTFNMQIQTFASALTVTFDSRDSTIVRFISDPNLTQLPANDSCSWYPNNNQALDSANWIPLETSSSSNVTVSATSLQIPAYSVGNYSFSIMLSNLNESYYYALMPTISIVAAAGNGTAAQSVAAYYPVTLGQSDFKGSSSTALSGPC
ncbi:MAG: hypothetical protein JRN20_15635 [Nitrososphaerota archaeon]|nr:hypothetical protein [Nitrososphaerota archaeon]